VGTFVYPKINKPDTKFNPDGSFELKIRYTEEEAQPIIAQITKYRDEAYVELCKEQKKAKLKMAELPIRKETDKEGNETGNYILSAKLKAKFKGTDGSVVEKKVAIFDSKGKPTQAEVWGGTRGKMSCQVVPYFTAAVGAGISLRLQAVQVLELVSAGQGGSAESYGFSKEDGYEAEVKAAEGTSDAEEPTMAATQSGEF
jgi:hypothetical protein